LTQTQIGKHLLYNLVFFGALLSSSTITQDQYCTLVIFLELLVVIVSKKT